MKEIIQSVFYNAHQTGSLEIGLDFCGDYSEVGKKDNNKEVVFIKEFSPQNGLQRHFVEILYSDKSRKKVFNVSEINYKTV